MTAYARLSAGESIFIHEGSTLGFSLDLVGLTNHAITWHYFTTTEGETADASDLGGTSGSGSLSVVSNYPKTKKNNFTISAVRDDVKESVETAFLVAQVSGGFGFSFSDGSYEKVIQINIIDNNLTNGTSGKDRLYGTGQAEKLVGLEGNDIYHVTLGDRVVETAKGGVDTVVAPIDWSLHANVENIILAGSDALVGKGNSLANLITGNIGDNRLYGGAGNDTLNGGAGNDKVNGGVGDDSVSGSSGNDALFGFDGNDWVSGGSGNDLLNGGSGKDTLLGGSGADKMDGGLGSDHLDGGTGDDKLLGGDGDDTLSGGAGRDQLSGGNGRDTIDGGTGKDALTGGKSADVFLFRTVSDSTPGRDRDVITDFTRGDKIDLSGIDANIRARGNQDFDFDGTTADANSVWYVRTGDKVVLRADTNGDTRADFEVALTGITRLIESDFIF